MTNSTDKKKFWMYLGVRYIFPVAVIPFCISGIINQELFFLIRIYAFWYGFRLLQNIIFFKFDEFELAYKKLKK